MNGYWWGILMFGGGLLVICHWCYRNWQWPDNDWPKDW
jgi:hypothetical protein